MYASAVEGKLFGENLLHFGEKLVEAIKTFVDDRFIEVSKQVNKGDHYGDYFFADCIRMMIRLNDLGRFLERFESFKNKLLDIQEGEDKRNRMARICDVHYDSLLNNSRNQMVKLVALWFIRRDFQERYMIEVFTKDWALGKKQDFVAESIQKMDAYIDDISKMIKNTVSQERIVNMIYSLMVDAYIEKFTIAVFAHQKKLKLQNESSIILTKLATSKKISHLDVKKCARAKSDADKKLYEGLIENIEEDSWRLNNLHEKDMPVSSSMTAS